MIVRCGSPTCSAETTAHVRSDGGIVIHDDGWTFDPEEMMGMLCPRCSADAEPVPDQVH